MPPRGVGAFAGEYPAQDYRTVKSKKLKEMDADIKSVVDSITNLTDRNSFYRLLTQYVSEELIAFCVEVLDMAVSIAPYETGELRSSGQVNFYVGGGHTSALIAEVEADSSGGYKVKKLVDSINRPASKIEAEISFEKVDKGIDIALWAHEDLLPWINRPKRGDQIGKWYARQPGPEPKSTGPKYLSRAVDEYRPKLTGLMETATVKAIQEYNRKHGTRVRRGRRA